MPELAEVETIVRGLKSQINGDKILDAKNFRPNIRIPFPENFTSALLNVTITDIYRRAKYIVMKLDDGNCLVIHLGMSGKVLVYESHTQSLKKHDHAVFLLNSGRLMVYNDPRRFGLITIINTKEIESHDLFKNLGPEPFSDSFSKEYLFQKLQNKKSPIKLSIMDQSIVVGIGNIYASESLYLARISPLRASNSLSLEELEGLIIASREVLAAAIKSGGSTLRDYVASSGDVGNFQHQFKVYGKAGQACGSCGSPIQKITQGQRSTFYCATHQR